MTETRKAQLEVGVDPGPAKAGFREIEQSADGMARKVGQAGEKAGDGLDKGMGDGVKGAGAKVDRETRSIIKSIERATAAAESGGRQTAAYFETLARQRGISGDALAPYIAQLKAAERAQELANASIGKMGLSAKQTSTALAGLPAQFTDIVTSLQAGQAPLQVLLQQGGQIKDMFGGAGNAARALGGYVASLISPLTVAGTAAAALAVGFFAGAKEAQEFNKVLVLTGNQAGVTVGALTAMAARLDSLGTTQGKASEVLTEFARSGKVGAENLERFALAAIKLEQVGGPAAAETAKAFADLGKEPLQASLRLNEATGFLTKSVYEQVKALTEQGRETEAARVAQEAYAAALEDRTPQIVAQLGYVERAWKGIVDLGKEAIDALKSVGRVDNTLQAAIARTEQQASNARAVGDSAAADQADRLLERLRQSLDLENQVTRAKADQKRQTDALVEADKELERLGVKRISLAQQEETLRRKLAAAGKDEETIQKAIAALREKGRDKGGSNQASRALEEEARALEKLRGLSGSYFKELAQLTALRDKGLITEKEFAKAYDDLAKQQPINVALAKQEADARKAVAQAAAEQIKAADQQLAAVRKSADSVAEQVQKLRDEEQAAAIAAAQNITLAQAIAQVTAARLEEAAAKATAIGDFETAAAIRAEIEARRELATLIDSRDARNAAQRSAQDAAREWQRASQDIERSLTDALLRGFESGKGFAKVLRDTLVNMFNAMVLRPIIQPLVGGALGGLGLSGPAGAGGPLGQIQQGSSFLSSLSSLMGGTGVTTGATLGFANTFNLGSQLALAGQTGTGLSTAGQLIGQGNYAAGFGTGAGALAPWAAGLGVGIYGGRAISNGYSLGGSGNTLVNAGTAIGAVFGGPIGAAIGGAIAGGINRAFGRRPREVTEAGISGTIGGGDLVGQAFEDWQRKGGWFRSTKRGTDFSSIDSELEMGLDLGARAILENTKAWAQALSLPAEQLASITTSFRTKLTGNAQEDQAAIAAVMQGYSDALTGGFAEQLAPFRTQGETAAQTLERLAGSLTGVNDVLGVLGQSLLAVTTLGGDTASKLLDQFGGLQQFQAVAGQYLQEYYTEAERTALATQQLTRQLASVGLAVPASREAYRDLVEAQDLNTESGRKAYTALLQLAPQFAQLVPAIEGVGNAATEAARQAEAGRRVLEDLTRSGGDLQVELLQAQGRAAEAAALARQQALGQLTAGLSATDAAAAAALFDLNAARRAEIDALRATEQQAQAVAAQRDGLTEQLLQLQGNTAELRARELAALDPANRALQEQINALLDQQAAAQAAAQALQAFQGVLGNLADQRADLEAQLLQAQGRVVEAQALIRQRELARLTAGLTAEQAAQVTAAYDANEALRAQIQATTDAQRAAEQLAAEQSRAAEEAQRAAEQFRSAWQSVSDTLFDEAARIRGLLTGSSPQGFASAQAQFALTTAQARAGDQEAAKLLPGLSQTLLQLAEANATSLLDLKRIRAQIAASLEQTGSGLAGAYGLNIPKLATGTNLVPKDMLALLHQGEAVVPRAFNPAAGGSEAGSAQVVAELRAVQAELREMRARLDAVNRNTGRVASAVEGNQSTPILVELAP